MRGLVVEEEEVRSRILRSVHDANHLGVNRTRDMISSKLLAKEIQS